MRTMTKLGVFLIVCAICLIVYKLLIKPSSYVTGGWIMRDPKTQGPGITHYYDCCKETCSWYGNANTYGVTQCDYKGANMQAPDNATEFPPSVCDTPQGNATCTNRYPEIINKVLYGFVASGAELKKDFQEIHGNGSCGQCFEIEFYEGKRNFDKAYVQVTNTGDGAGVFDFEVPGGGFGANNGCKNYSDWKVYEDQGGPCASDGVTDTAQCLRYGGLQDVALCDTVFGSDEPAASACRNIMFGGLMQDKGNILVKRYRPIACPKWFSDKTGTSGPPVDAIKQTIPHM